MTFDVADEPVGDRQHNDLDGGLVDPAQCGVGGEVGEAGDPDGGRGDGAEHQGVTELAGEGGPDQSGPQVLLLGPLLDLDHGPGVDRLPDDEPGQAGHDQLGVRADDVGEMLLVRIEVGGGKVDGHPECQCCKAIHDESEQNGPPGCGESVDLGQHVADDVGEREDDEPAVGDDGSESHTFGGGDIGDDHQRGEHRDQNRVVAATDLSKTGLGHGLGHGTNPSTAISSERGPVGAATARPPPGRTAGRRSRSRRRDPCR